MELDPVFIRALRLLHSTSKESGIQLKAMLDESIRMKKNPGLQPSKITAPAPQQSKDANVKDNDRRNLDKLKRDLSELVPESKKPRIHSPARSSPGLAPSGGFSKSHTPSPTPTPTPPNHGDHQSGGNSSADELDLDVDLEGLNDLCCSICKTLNQGNGNKLMECHTCQNLYHQECHKPAISNQEADDPRLVWNCSNCSGPKVPKVAHSSSKISSSKTSKVSTMQPLKSARPTSGRSDLSSSAVFKRTDTSKSHGAPSNSASGGKPAGMAALAATYKGSSGSSTSSNLKSSSRSGTHGSSFGHSKTSSGSSSTTSSSSTIMSADKRLQLMKKKAAQRKK